MQVCKSLIAQFNNILFFKGSRRYIKVSERVPQYKMLSCPDGCKNEISYPDRFNKMIYFHYPHQFLFRLDGLKLCVYS